MPSADFCAAVRSPCDGLSPQTGTQHRPPEVRPTAFAARPPDLPPRPLMTVDFAISCSPVRLGRPRDPVLVHRAATLIHAFFRPHLAASPLRFASPSPSSGWTEDFHLQAVVHTRHTTRSRPTAARLLTNLRLTLPEANFTERLGFKSPTKQNQNPSFSGAYEKRGVCNQSEPPEGGSQFQSQ